MTVSRREELAWCAGFLDGEGYFAFSRHSGTRGQVKIQASQVDDRPLLRLAASLGGSVTGPYEIKRPNCPPNWSWSTASFGGVMQAVCLVWPWLSQPKRDQAHGALLAARAHWLANPSKRRRVRQRHPDGTFAADQDDRPVTLVEALDHLAHEFNETQETRK